MKTIICTLRILIWTNCTKSNLTLKNTFRSVTINTVLTLLLSSKQEYSNLNSVHLDKNHSTTLFLSKRKIFIKGKPLE